MNASSSNPTETSLEDISEKLSSLIKEEKPLPRKKLLEPFDHEHETFSQFQRCLELDNFSDTSYQVLEVLIYHTRVAISAATFLPYADIIIIGTKSGELYSYDTSTKCLLVHTPPFRGLSKISAFGVKDRDIFVALANGHVYRGFDENASLFTVLPTQVRKLKPLSKDMVILSTQNTLYLCENQKQPKSLKSTGLIKDILWNDLINEGVLITATQIFIITSDFEVIEFEFKKIDWKTDFKVLYEGGDLSKNGNILTVVSKRMNTIKTNDPVRSNAEARQAEVHNFVLDRGDVCKGLQGIFEQDVIEWLTQWTKGNQEKYLLTVKH